MEIEGFFETDNIYIYIYSTLEESIHPKGLYQSNYQSLLNYNLFKESNEIVYEVHSTITISMENGTFCFYLQ
jgi:hypothetical protein